MCNTKYLRKAILTLMILIGTGIFFGAHSHAYATDKAALEQQFHQAFNQMLKDPANVDLTTRYAELAVELGDYEAAIPPLERLLMNDPEQNDVKLELGVLYFLLNSHNIAKEYLGEVANSGTATPEQIKRANEYLAKM